MYISQLMKKPITINMKNVILGSFSDILHGRNKKIATSILMIGCVTLHNLFHSNIKILKPNDNYLLGVINASMSSLKYLPSVSLLRHYMRTPTYNLDGSSFVTLNSRFEENGKYVNSTSCIKNQRFTPFAFKSFFNMFLFDDQSLKSKENTNEKVKSYIPVTSPFVQPYSILIKDIQKP